MGFLVKLDTNGYKPELLSDLIDSNLLDYVAMDIKNSKEKYGLTVDIENFDLAPILKSIDILINSKIEYEFRTTVVKELHNESDIIKISEWIKNSKKYFLQGFIDSGDILNGSFNGYDENTMKNLLKLSQESIKHTELRGF